MLLLPPRLRATLEAIARQDGGSVHVVLRHLDRKHARRQLAELAAHNLVRWCRRGRLRREGILSVWATPKGMARAALAVPPDVQDRAYWLNQIMDAIKQHPEFPGSAEQLTAMADAFLNDDAVEFLTGRDSVDCAGPMVRAIASEMLRRCGVEASAIQHPRRSVGQDQGFSFFPP